MPDQTKLIEELLDLQIPNDVRLSPNAQQLVYPTSLLVDHKTGEHALSTVWIAETGIAHSARQLTSGLFNDQAPRWSPDGRSIAFISDRGKQGESSAIYVLPVHTGGEAYPVTPANNERSIAGMEWSPDGKSIAFLAADEKTAEQKAKDKNKDDAHVWGEDWQYHRLRLVHISTKTITTLVSHDAHVRHFAWNEDGTKIAFTTQETPDIESPHTHGMVISVVSTQDKQTRQICTTDYWISGFLWAGASLYFTAPSDGRSFLAGLMVFSVDPTASPATIRKEGYGETNNGERISKAGKEVTVAVDDGMEGQIAILGGRTVFSRKKNIDSWDAAFTIDSDEMVLAICQGDTNTPTEVYTVTASGGAMVQLSSHGQAFKGRKIGMPTFLTCESKSVKGETPVRLDGVFVTPPDCKLVDGKPERPIPTFVQIHGGPTSRDTDEFNPSYYHFTAPLLAAGYGVMTVNYRGSNGRGREFASCAIGGMGLYDYADVIEVVQCAIEKGFADKRRLVVSGWSQGGFLSYLCSTRNGQHDYGWKFSAAIPGAGITDWSTMALTSDIGCVEQEFAGIVAWKADKSDVTDRQGSALWEFKKAVEEKCIPPMLILHGEADVRVPVEQARGFRRALIDARLPFEYVTYPREDHIFKERKHMVDMAERVLKFVDLHIGSKQVSVEKTHQ